MNLRQASGASLRAATGLEARILEPHRHAVPNGLQRQRAEISRYLHHRSHKFPRAAARSPSPHRRRPFRAPLHFVFDDGRIFCGPLQQAQRHYRHESFRNRHHGLFHRQPCAAKLAHGMRGRVLDQRGRRALRPLEVRIAPRTPAGAEALVGQRDHRAWHVPRKRRRDDGSRDARRSLSRSRSCRWISAPRVYCGRPRHELWNFASSGCRSSQKVSLESYRRSLGRNRKDSRRQGAGLGRDRQHLSVLPRGLLQFIIVVYGHDVLHIDDANISYLQAALASASDLGALPPDICPEGKSSTG